MLDPEQSKFWLVVPKLSELTSKLHLSSLVLDPILEKHSFSACPHNSFYFYVVVSYSSNFSAWETPSSTTPSIPFPPQALVSKLLLTPVNIPSLAFCLFVTCWLEDISTWKSHRDPGQIQNIPTSNLTPILIFFICLIVPSPIQSLMLNKQKDLKLGIIVESLFFLTSVIQSITDLYWFYIT